MTLRETVKTRFGLFTLDATEKGLAALYFPGRSVPKIQPDQTGGTSQARSQARRNLTQARKSLEQYFKGGRVSFNRLSFDLRGWSPFESKVLKALSQVRQGDTSSYGELAAKAGSPRAARAVGSVMRKNRIPVLLPCHRVLPSSGGLGGYSGGLHWKKRLLAMEGK